jgi:4-aminobutyrate aminotransferase
MSWSKGHHGSTFGGNAVSCAVALETIALLQEGLIDNAKARGDQAIAGLTPLIQKHPGLVNDVRGKGLMIGIEFDTGETAEAVQWACFVRGLLVLEAGENVVRLCPPLVVTADEIDTCVRILGESIADVAGDPKRAYDESRKWMSIDDGEVDG